MLCFGAAFDTVDHSFLLERLRQWVGVSGSALDWFSSYLSDRSFSVSLGPYMSETAALSCGVPQGSVLGPILFALYSCGQKFTYTCKEHVYHGSLEFPIISTSLIFL